GLIFPNDRFNSTLQLIRGSLSSPEYELLGDTIPYSFYDVRSFADLYYSPAGKRLVAVTLYTNKDNKTDVRIYTIAFPPYAISPVVVAASPSTPWWGYALAIAGLGGLTWVMFGRKKKAAPVAAAAAAPVASAPVIQQEPPPVPVTPIANIYFFGPFEVV